MSNSKIYKIGVIGVGVWGCHSLERELVNTNMCEIKSICGGDEFGAALYKDTVKASKDYAQEFNAGYIVNPEDIINDPEIDIISVMCAPSIKAEWLIKALQNNKYVVTDKPLGLTLEDAQAVCEAEAKSKAHGFMLGGYHIRPAVCKLIDMINAGKLGEVKSVSLRLNFTGGIYLGFEPTERWGSEIPGGESVTIGSHGLITAMKLIGAPVEDVFQIRKNDFYEKYKSVGADDYAIYNLKFTNGAVANVSVGRLPYRIPNEDIVIELTGTEGYAHINGTELKTYPDGEIFDGKFSAPELTCDVFKQFIHSITDKNTSPLTSFKDGLTIQQIFDKYKKTSEEK
ncbi:MAG: Gfo/Idh/MocA family oxidoreductase [Verrucomicrobiota bacterium]|nr:Gfo/Idh/MocA family oxidoreductase [Verrucomicrobiota bacterium]